MAKKTNHKWQNKICNSSQVGGIETSVINDGPGKDNRVAWINTGSGLRYKVVLDRCLDIYDAFFNQHSLAWLSHGGLTRPRPDANEGVEWLYSFGGGLMITCGLTHIGGPEEDASGKRGLHGRIGNMPATIESIVQPDLSAGKLDMSITGVIKESSVFGPNLELRRTISSTIGEPVIRVRDVVTNKAAVSVPHMILYHCNFGWPLVDEGADIIWRGKMKSRGLEMDDEVFNSRLNYRKCQKPLENHRPPRESCAFIEVDADKSGVCTVGIHNKKAKMALVMKYNKKQLPMLTNWQKWGFGEYICALEPGTNPPTGQINARKQKKLINLKAGQSRTYELEIGILTDKSEIDKFIKTAGPKK